MKQYAKGYSVIFVLVFVVVLGCVGYLAYSRIEPTQPKLQETPVVSKPKKKSFSFNAAGDFKNESNAKTVLQAMGADTADFSLALGDLSYGAKGSEQAWCDLVHESVGTTRPFELVVGNHDDGTSDHADFNVFRTCLPNKIDGIVGDYGTEYYFDYNDLARFIMIAPDINTYGFTYDNEQNTHLQWVVDAIKDARNSGINWVVVGMHKNCISISTKSCEIGEDLLNKLLELKVDLVLQGHEHIYARTKQLALNKASCPQLLINGFDQDCIVDGDNELAKGKGSVVVISGAGGYDLRTIEMQDPEIGYFAEYNGINIGKSFGFSHVDVSEEKLDVSFIPAIGDYYDGFSILANE